MAEFKFGAVHKGVVGVIIEFNNFLLSEDEPVVLRVNEGAGMRRCEMGAGFNGVEFKLPFIGFNFDFVPGSIIIDPLMGGADTHASVFNAIKGFNGVVRFSIVERVRASHNGSDLKIEDNK